jgi:DNA-binding CsgD family transcriptional regulator
MSQIPTDWAYQLLFQVGTRIAVFGTPGQTALQPANRKSKMSLPRSSEFLIPEEKVREVVSLIGRVISSDGDIHFKRRLLMDGLCELVDATAWVWCVANSNPFYPKADSGIVHSAPDAGRFSSFIGALHHPDAQRISSGDPEESWHRDSLLPRAPSLGKSSVTEMWNLANIGPILISQRSIETGGVSGIGIYREVGCGEFTPLETKIAEMVLSEVPWLHFAAFREQDREKIANLYPRHRTVLNLLCEGWSRKKIADHLNLSVNTVHGYSKVIFKHFGVHSQAELLAKFTKGSGGDQ